MVNIQGNDCMDFAITLEFAKHIAMMARSKKAHEYRDYFIACEEKLKEIDPKANLLVSIYNGGQSAVLASNSSMNLWSNRC